MNQRTLALALCTALVVNALWFTASTAIPLPSSDAWFFIDTFVRKALQGHLQLADFFAQRFAGDHAQPLHRLLLFAHLKLFGLDFRYEAIVGICLAVVTCALLGTTLVASAPDQARGRRGWWGVAAIFAVGLSLNATMIYTWSLVSLGWISMLAAVAYWMAAARMRDDRGALVMGLASLALSLVTDELAIATFAATVGALLVRDRGRLPAALRLCLAGGVGLLAGRWFINLLDGSVAAATSGSLGQLAELARRPDAWKLFVVPLADSVVHRQHLVEWFPRLAPMLELALGALLLLLHAGFWWRALGSRNRPAGPVLVVAVACMLFFYAAVAGILLSRVTQHGFEYLHQPRYVFLYGFNLIALILMGFGSPASAPGTAASRWAGRAAGTLTILLVFTQVPLAQAAWREAPYVRQYTARMATALDALARDPNVLPAGGCPPTLRLCDRPAASRAAVIAMMRSYRLSLFSPRFQARYGLGNARLGAISTMPGRSAAPHPATAEACDIHVLKQAPSTIVPGKAFLPQANGQSAFWLTVPTGTPPFQIEFEGQPVHTHRRGEVVTFLHDERQIRAVQAGRPLHFELRCAGARVGSFDVAVAR